MKKILLLILLIVIHVGCDKTPLYYIYPPGGELHIVTDWSDTKTLPNEMVSYFYDFDQDGQPIEHTPHFEYMSNAGGTVFLPYGTYKSFIYNNNIKDIMFRNMDHYDTAEAYLEPDSKTPPFATRTQISSNINYIGQIGDLFTSPIDDFSFNENATEYSTEVSPKLLTKTMMLRLKVKNLTACSRANGTLSGVAQTINLSTCETNPEHTANVIFDFSIDIIEGSTDGYITAYVNYFELLRDDNDDNVLELAFKLRDSEGTELISGHESELPEGLTFDYSSLIRSIKDALTPEVRKDGGEIVLDKNSEGGSYVEIVLPEIEVEEIDGGFDAEVDDWVDGEIIDLPI